MNPHRVSLRRYLLTGILVPVVAFVALGAASLYRAALVAADTAYDRTLLASAKAIGEQLHVKGEGSEVHVTADVPYSALEAFEADSRSRMFYRILGFRGETVSGFAGLPAPRPAEAGTSPYAALVHFYDDAHEGQPVRMAVLLQPVAGLSGHGMATIQVAETFELRHRLAHELLMQTLLQQATLIALIGGVVVWVVQRATRPVRALSEGMRARDAGDLSPLSTENAPRELMPVLDATNGVMARLARLLEHQKRFVRDASHQLRTPLAVLKTQVQSAQRGDVAPTQALREIAQTIDRATELANQMLALAKVEQLRQSGVPPVADWTAIVQAVALDLAPLIAQRHLDFELDSRPAMVRGHEWALRELVRNLLHNAIKQSPDGGRLELRMRCDAQVAALTVADAGPGLTDDLRQRLFQPFSSGDPRGGAGLGLTICREIAESMGGRIQLDNREHAGRVTGLDAVVRLPLATP
jgi:two-component system, OmpR family, sensor histidine kinase TctE